MFSAGEGKRVSGFSGRDQEWIWRELAQIVRQGRPLPAAVREMADAGWGLRRRAPLRKLAAALEEGRSLSEAVEQLERHFHPGAAAAVRSGEEGDRLAEVLFSLADSARQRTSLRYRIALAITYPVIMTLFASLILCFIAFWIHPMFHQMYDELAIQLPAMTMLVGVGFHLGAATCMLIPAALLFLLYIIPPFLAPPRKIMDLLRLKFPLVGRSMKQIVLTRWCGAMGLLVNAGIPEPAALRLAGEGSGNAVMNAHSRRMADRVASGQNLGSVMLSNTFFPGPLVWMVQASEAAGGHARVWAIAEDLYRDRADLWARVAGIFLYVFFALLTFAVVAATVIALMLPLVRLMGAMGGGF